MLRWALRAGGAVAGVADGVVAGERRQRRRGEHVGDEPGVLVHARAAAVADGDAGRLLPAVLQREQAEERQLGDAVAVRRRDAEHAALLLRGVVGSIHRLRTCTGVVRTTCCRCATMRGRRPGTRRARTCVPVRRS